MSDETSPRGELPAAIDREQLDAAQRLAHFGSWAWDLKADRVTWSDELARIFGYEPGEVEPSWPLIQERIHPDDRDKLTGQIENAATEGGAAQGETRLIRPDGEVRTVAFWAGATADERGEPRIMRGATLDITESRISQHERHLQARLLDEANVALIGADKNLVVTQWNAGAERLYEIDREKAIGTRLPDLDIRTEGIDGEAIRNKISGTDERWSGYFSIRKRNGQLAPAYGSVSQIRGPDGQVSGLVGVTIDRRSQEAAEQELALQKSLTKGLIDASRAIVYVKDPSHRFLLVNRELEEAFGKSSVELLGETDAALISPEESEKIQANDRQVLESGTPIEVEERTIQDGRERVYLSQKFPLLDPDGNVFGLAGISSDITDQVDARRVVQRQALRQSIIAELGTTATRGLPFEELAGRAVEEVASALDVELAKVLELSKDGTGFKLRAAHGFGADLVGKATVPATPETHAGYTLQSREPVVLADLATETRFTGASLLHKHQVTSGVSVPILSTGSEPVYGVLTIHTRERRDFTADDVTFLESVATVLATAIARERTEILQRQLDRAQRLESLGKLAGGIAHDFNNLLAVITNYAAFLEEELSGRESLLEDVVEIRKAGERAADLTRQLLVFSRREIVQPEVLDPNVAIRETEKLLQRTIGEDIELRLDLGENAPRVRMGPGQLEQILLNLCINARDAMPTGGVLSLRTERTVLDWSISTSTGELPSGHYLLLTVADSGSGMKPEVAAQIFEPFFTTKQEGHGTGLGLATVYGIVEESNGRIQVYSEPERGSVFKVYLPASTGERLKPVVVAQDAATGQGETVLVVEDEEAVRRLTCKILRSGGYEVVEADSPEEAMRLFDAATPDLLLTDVVMPNMSGKDLAERCRETVPNLPVLYMSGYTGDIISRHGMLDDGVMVLEKPFTAARLLASVRQAMRTAP